MCSVDDHVARDLEDESVLMQVSSEEEMPARTSVSERQMNPRIAHVQSLAAPLSRKLIDLLSAALFRPLRVGLQ